MSTQPRVLLCEPLEAAARKILDEQVTVDEAYGLANGELRERLPDYAGLIVGGETYVSESIIEVGEKLRVIGRTATVKDRIDVAAAQDYGVEVIGTPLGSAVAIAEQVMMLVLGLAKSGLSGKTLGLIGFGRIAKQVARRASAFNLRIIVNQPRLTPELVEMPHIEAVELPELLQQSDFVSLHVPHLREGEALIDSAELAQMMPTASLINLAHADLINLPALIDALEAGVIASAAITNDPGIPEETPQALQVVERPSSPSHARTQTAMVRRFIRSLKVKKPSETLSLDIVPIRQVMPHEAFDQKRVDGLKASLNEDGVLQNPPLVTPWAGKYVILDGATRFNSLKQLGYPHIAVQLVEPDSDFTLQTWYHAISSKRPARELFDLLRTVAGIEFVPISADDWLDVFADPHAVCYFLDTDEKATLVRVEDANNKLAVMNEIVAAYTDWGKVERTLLTDIARLVGQFPQMVAVAVFNQFRPEEVFDVAKHGQLLPAGLTRFVIPGRVLRLNVSLGTLKSAETLSAKRAWLNDYLGDKFARSRIRYYQEPVVLIDE